MRHFKTVEEAHDLCVADGNVIPVAEIDQDQIRSCLKSANEDLQTARDSVSKRDGILPTRCIMMCFIS